MEPDKEKPAAKLENTAQWNKPTIIMYYSF